MTWNNRVFRHLVGGKELFALHETFYNHETGLMESWSEKPLTEFSESIDELIQDPDQKLADAKRFRNTALLPEATTKENNNIVQQMEKK